MQKLISSKSSTLRERFKDAHHRERKKSTVSCANQDVLLDILTLLEADDDLSGSHLRRCPVLTFSTKFSSVRNRALWDLACKKGYFVEKIESRKAILRPVLRLYNGVTDVTSDSIAGSYEQVQPLIFVRSRRDLEPFCKYALRSWLEHKLPKRPHSCSRLLGVAGLTFPTHSMKRELLEAMLADALTLFLNTHCEVGFPVLSGLGQHCKNVGMFLRRMQELRSKCSTTVEKPEHGLLAICGKKLPTGTGAGDGDDLDYSASTTRNQELHASKEIHTCLLYRFAMITNSILQYLIFINVGGRAVQAFAEEIMIVGVKQQITETVLEMYLDPSTRIIENIFEAVMSRVGAVLFKSGSSVKHVRVRTVQQCRIGAAVGAWQFVTFLLGAVSEAFANAAITEVGREEKNRKYLQDSLELIPRIKDDCLYRVFRLLSLKHRKLGLLKAQHQAQDPLDAVGANAVTLLSKVIVAYALHLFKTKRSTAKHAYLYEDDVREDFARFLLGLRTFTISVPQPPVTVNDLTGGRLPRFVMAMSVVYFKEVVDAREHQEKSPEEDGDGGK